MTNKMGLMALGLSMALLSGCGSSGGSDDIVNPETTSTETATTETENPETTSTETTSTTTTNTGTENVVFTYDLLVGKTYIATYDGGATLDERYEFSETEVIYTEDGVTDVVPYVIDENGVIIFNYGEGTATLISIDGSGDLRVTDGTEESLWVLVS